MAKILFGTGKKKKVQAVLAYYQALEKQKKIEILSKKVSTKRALFWNYDELRLLFEIPPGSRIPTPDKELAALDTHSFKERAQIVVDFETPMVPDDNMLKVKILTLCHGYTNRGLQVKIDLKMHKETEYRIHYQCTGRLHGPLDAVMTCCKHLQGEKLISGDSIKYLF